MDAIDVANFFIDTAKDDDTIKGVSKLGVNKLMYFAQLAYMRKYGKPLFHDDVEVWQYGPVVPKVEHELDSRGYRDGDNKKKISSVIGDYDYYDIPEDAMDVLMDVYMHYAYDSNASQLVEESHVKGSPWDRSYDPTKRHTKVSEDDLKKYANSTVILPSSGMRRYHGTAEGSPRHDGRPVLPREFEDDPDYSA